jgi:hypothetical protein
MRDNEAKAECDKMQLCLTFNNDDNRPLNDIVNGIVACDCTLWSSIPVAITTNDPHFVMTKCLKLVTIFTLTLPTTNSGDSFKMK